jgi:hypothetical protein
VDTAINTLTLVDALIVTIPFGIVSAANYTFWDWLQTLPCNTDDFHHDHFGELPYYYFYYRFVGSIWQIVISCVIGIVLATFYYLLRPSDDEVFLRWWTRGKVVLVFSVVATAIGVLSTLYLAGLLLDGWWVISTSQACDAGELGYVVDSRGSLASGYVILALVSAFSILMMI